MEGHCNNNDDDDDIHVGHLNTIIKPENYFKADQVHLI